MLKTLHLVIQAATGWENVHLFQYDVGGYRANGGGARIADLAACGVRRFSYIYSVGLGLAGTSQYLLLYPDSA
ncbi:MAG: hypothetical protein KGM97_02740 [Alphaproteobacteria bacterium]|nr:hypothetical protein [Alphaproteobacteria bacterium]MDE2629887.1 hypothetical protein [Alphaproteobacteria bacterium]